MSNETESTLHRSVIEAAKRWRNVIKYGTTSQLYVNAESELVEAVDALRYYEKYGSTIQDSPIDPRD